MSRSCGRSGEPGRTDRAVAAGLRGSPLISSRVRLDEIDFTRNGSEGRFCKSVPPPAGRIRGVWRRAVRNHAPGACSATSDGGCIDFTTVRDGLSARTRQDPRARSPRGASAVARRRRRSVARRHRPEVADHAVDHRPGCADRRRRAAFISGAAKPKSISPRVSSWPSLRGRFRRHRLKPIPRPAVGARRARVSRRRAARGPRGWARSASGGATRRPPSHVARGCRAAG